MNPIVQQLFVIAAVIWLVHGLWIYWHLAAETAKQDGATVAQAVVAFALVAGVFTLARSAVAFAVYRVACFVIGGSP